MHRRLKLQTVERVLFALVFVALGVGGAVYGRLQDEMPGLQLPAAICASFGLVYVIYRVALRWAIQNIVE
mgnify:CR=1 FL=1